MKIDKILNAISIFLIAFFNIVAPYVTYVLISLFLVACLFGFSKHITAVQYIITIGFIGYNTYLLHKEK